MFEMYAAATVLIEGLIGEGWREVTLGDVTLDQI